MTARAVKVVACDLSLQSSQRERRFGVTSLTATPDADSPSRGVDREGGHVVLLCGVVVFFIEFFCVVLVGVRGVRVGHRDIV